MRSVVVILVAAGVLVVATIAGAKDFDPGALRICNDARCISIERRSALKPLADMYYRWTPRRVPAPRLGAVAYELRFQNGYVTGIVGTRRLDRFLSYGVNLGHFGRGRWYLVPARASAELRRLAARLRSLHVTRGALAKSR